MLSSSITFRNSVSSRDTSFQVRHRVGQADRLAPVSIAKGGKTKTSFVLVGAPRVLPLYRGNDKQVGVFKRKHVPNTNERFSVAEQQPFIHKTELKGNTQVSRLITTALSAISQRLYIYRLGWSISSTLSTGSMLSTSSITSISSICSTGSIGSICSSVSTLSTPSTPVDHVQPVLAESRVGQVTGSARDSGPELTV